jgi:hypothetical protein
MKVYVVFTDGPIDHWWSWFTKKGYKHCFALVPIELDGRHLCLRIDWRVNYMMTPLYTNSVFEVIKAEEDVTEVHLVRVAKTPQMKYIIDIRSCVTIIKSMLNARWLFTQTPWALCKKLRKQKNAVRVR